MGKRSEGRAEEEGEMSDSTVLDPTFYVCLKSLTGVIVHSNERGNVHPRR